MNQHGTSRPTDTTDSPTMRVRKLSHEAVLPQYKSEGAAGMDLAACLPEGPLTIPAGSIARVPTGIAIAIESGYEGQVRPRSGLASNHGVTLPNTPGTIDSDYRGEVLVPLINLGREPFIIEHGMRIAQLVIAPVVRVRITESDELDQTERGSAGFGSTGVH